ncbi:MULTISPECIES: phospholipase effector Tle1 domain-containing protein [unclassified Pseudomonas]|uniref:phospholipase effector Tle1 domain-containing protein n=1 Tax=unclassified Pseudomonas TaxID=196821 RepID=UPI0038082682
MGDALRFTVYFDGTGNNKDLNTPEGTQTNVARLFELDTAKGTNLARNSGHAPQQYDAQERSGQSEKVYFDGVGSQAKTSARSALEGGTGLGGQERIDQAYDSIVAFHNKYPDQKVDVNIVGFSRGAAQSRALANEFIERGVPKLDDQGKATGDFLIPPGQAHVNKLGIFDTVASYGNAMSDTHLGKNLEVGKNVDSTTHLVAANEYRDTFRLTSALRNDDNSRIEELKFPGAHSQVGGGYKDDVLAAGPLAVMYDRLQSAGIEMKPMQRDDVQRIDQYNDVIKSPEKVQEALIDSRLVNGKDAFTRGVDGSFQVVDNTPFPMERGTINVFDRQARPFDHQTNGRGVIFENDNSLSKSGVQRGAESVGNWFAEKGTQLKDRASEYLGMRNRSERQEARAEDSFEQELAKYREAAIQQGQDMANTMTGSRPDQSFISSLNLQPVPVPKDLKQGQQQDTLAQERSDSFKAMEEKARGLNPSASIGEASQTGRKATSGMVVGMDEHHILQKVGQTDQFVIHDRRDVDPSRNFQVGKSTAIVNEKGIGEVARDLAPKLELDVGLSQAMRR